MTVMTSPAGTKVRTGLLSVAALALGLLAFSPSAAVADEEKESRSTFENIELFGDALERVLDSYVEDVTEEQLIEYAIKGMLSSLDPHSGFLNQREYRNMNVNNRGEFGGLGIQVTMEGGYVKVVSPIDDTPAHRAGIKPGDYITHIEGESVLDLTLDEAVDKMRGPVNTEINLTIRRPGEEGFDVTLTRAIIPLHTVRSRLEGDVGYIRITQFGGHTTDGLEKAFEDLNEGGQDLKGYVLDLRGNPGGLLDQALNVSDAFLDRGEIVSTRARDPKDMQRFHAKEGDLAEGKPVVVLINEGSASASEIVAGALQDHRRALVMGVKSFGKGSVQTIMPIGEQMALKLTTQRYYTPSGRSIQAVGIDPDIVVNPANIESLEQNGTVHRESSYRRALKNDNGEDKPDAANDNEEAAEAEPEEPEDYQLLRALDLIRGMAIMQQAKAE